MLLFSIFSMGSAILFLRLNFPILSVCLFGIAPLTSISQASYCDVHIANNRDPNVVNTFIPQAIPWLILYKFVRSSDVFFLLSISLAIIGIFLGIFFMDIQDRKKISLLKTLKQTFQLRIDRYTAPR